MSEPTVSKWNARYAHSGGGIPAPSEVLSRGARWLPEVQVPLNDGAASQLCALDLACGLGGNAHFLAKAGFIVSAWDISDVVIKQIRGRKPVVIAHPELRDVVTYPPEPSSFDVIVVSRFLDRALCPHIIDALRPDGVLFYQTFVRGLKNKNFMLKPNELLSLFKPLHVLEYHEPEPQPEHQCGESIGGTAASAQVQGGAKNPVNASSEATLIARRSS